MRVVVSQEDIELGIRGHIASCPVARALQRAGFKDALVFDESWAENRKNNTLHLLEKEVRDWIHNFDNELPVQPFEFEVEDGR